MSFSTVVYCCTTTEAHTAVHCSSLCPKHIRFSVTRSLMECYFCNHKYYLLLSCTFMFAFNSLVFATDSEAPLLQQQSTRVDLIPHPP